jgi:HEAT repeat protein
VRKLLAICTAVLLAGCGGRPTADWIDLLRSKDAAQRLHAIKALEKKRSEAATVVPALTGVLGDGDSFVRRDAAKALGSFGPEGRPALPALLPLLRDRSAGVRKAAAGALKAIDADEAARAGVR